MNYRVKEARERINSILNQLIEYGFDEALNNPEDMYHWFHHHRLDLPDNLAWGAGASRMVVYDKNHLDYVLKVDLDECDIYCNKEATIFAAAELEGLEEYFAWCNYILEYKGFHFYAMEYVECDGYTVSDMSVKHQYQLYCDSYGYDPYNEDIKEDFFNSDASWDAEGTVAIGELLDFYWGEISDLINNFLVKNDVNDIHSDNVGLKDGRLVIIDYAGW